jgi:chemotaxis protein methyltransferase CheR
MSPQAPLRPAPAVPASTAPAPGSARAAVNAVTGRPSMQAPGTISSSAPTPSATGATAPPQVNDADLEFIRDFLKARAGISLAREKRYLVDSRLGPMARKRGFASLDAMIQELRGRRPPDLERAVVEAMTTNETLFFRDRQPFELIRQSILPGLMSARAATRQLRIWCAAASTGQEPYSLAMILHEHAAQLRGWRVDILATDISTDCLERARAGLYTQFEVQRGLPIQMLLKHFTQNGETWQIAPELRAMVDFRPLNLIQDFTRLGTFDLIMCRNVLIYFEPTLKTQVFDGIARCLTPDGFLMLGGAETVLGLTDSLMPHPTLRGSYVRRPDGVPADPQRR